MRCWISSDRSRTIRNPDGRTRGTPRVRGCAGVVPVWFCCAHHSENTCKSRCWSIPAGNEAFGVFLKTDVDRNYTDKWRNTIRITDLTATLRDDTPNASFPDGIDHTKAPSSGVTCSCGEPTNDSLRRRAFM